MGSLEGVIATQAAWIGKREVVEVQFQPGVLSYARLLDHAIAKSCDQWIYATTDAQLAAASAKVGERVERHSGELRVAKASDQLYYLLASPLNYLPLTPVQARQVNGALGLKASPDRYLSPRQKALAERIPEALRKDADALKGLERPGNTTELDEYEAELRERLN